jgi:hypothetical protein
MARKSSEAVPEVKNEAVPSVSPLALARSNVVALREKLAQAQLAEVAARVAEGAVAPGAFTDPLAYHSAKSEAVNRTAVASSAVAFHSQKLAEAETTVRPLEVAEAQVAHETARTRRTDAVAALVAKLDAVPEFLGPVVAAVRDVATAHADVGLTANGLERLDVRAPHDGGIEEVMLADKATITKLDGRAAEVLVALSGLVKLHGERVDRERQQEESRREVERVRHQEWLRRARLGELGEEAAKQAAAEDKAAADTFYGRHPARNVDAVMPRLDPEVATYRRNAGLDRVLE